MAPKAKKSTAYVEQNRSLTGYEKSSLSEYSIRELKSLASNYGIKNYGSLTKDQLIKEISKNEKYIEAKEGKEEKSKSGLEKYIKERAGTSAHGATWYRQQVYDYLSKKDTLEPKVGNLYFFQYDAKWKKNLPIWDVYPLAIMVRVPAADIFLGGNLHYLKGNIRTQMVKQLLNNSNQPMPKQTLHTYLFDHLETFFFEVDREDWEFISTLPLEEFIKKDNGK